MPPPSEDNSCQDRAPTRARLVGLVGVPSLLRTGARLLVLLVLLVATATATLLRLLLLVILLRLHLVEVTGQWTNSPLKSVEQVENEDGA
jgi:hypothetical protein